MSAMPHCQTRYPSSLRRAWAGDAPLSTTNSPKKAFASTLLPGVPQIEIPLEIPFEPGFIAAVSVPLTLPIDDAPLKTPPSRKLVFVASVVPIDTFEPANIFGVLPKLECFRWKRQRLPPATLEPSNAIEKLASPVFVRPMK